MSAGRRRDLDDHPWKLYAFALCQGFTIAGAAELGAGLNPWTTYFKLGLGVLGSGILFFTKEG